MLAFFLGVLLFSFFSTSILVIPFINFLYKISFTRKKQKTKDFQDQRTPIFDHFHKNKTGTPVGGGILVIISVSLLYLFLFSLIKASSFSISANYPATKELNIVFFVFLSFGLLGFYDDIMKLFGFKRTGFFGLRMRFKLLLQILLAGLASALIYFQLGINFINLPLLGPLHLGLFFPILSTFLIVIFANAYNITDGLDGLSSGLLMICLFAFWLLSATALDTPISLFLALWIGAIIAFLYFNVFPARIWLGDTGSLSFGATIAVIAILIGKTIPLLIIGAPFLIEFTSSFLQIMSKQLTHKKLFPAAPIHLTLQHMGWEEPKIVARAWLAGIIFAIFGLWLALL